MCLVALNDGDNLGVEDMEQSGHILIKNFQGIDALGASDNFDARCITDVVAGNQGAGVLWLKGVFNAQWNIALAQAFGRLWVYGFHPQVGQLVGDIVIGAANGHGLGFADQARIGA